MGLFDCGELARMISMGRPGAKMEKIFIDSNARRMRGIYLLDRSFAKQFEQFYRSNLRTVDEDPMLHELLLQKSIEIEQPNINLPNALYRK